MTWVKLTDLFDDHRKVKRLWRTCPQALGLHVMALTYCARHETDGLVDHEYIAEKAPVAKARDRMIAALVECGLWDVDGDGWRIHDFLDFNPSRAAQDEKRQRDAERKAAGRATQAAQRPSSVRPVSARSPSGHDAESERSPRGVRDVSSGPVPTRPVPDPANSPPSPPRGGRRRDLHRFEEECRQTAQRLFPDAHAEDATEVVKGAIADKATDDDGILAWTRRWRPDLLADGAAA